MSAVTPAPEEGSNPAIVNTTGGDKAIGALYQTQTRASLSQPAGQVTSGFGAVTGIVIPLRGAYQAHEQCLTQAIENNEAHGIAGFLTKQCTCN